MFSRFKYQNWKGNEPSNIIEYFFSPCPWGMRIVNFVFQKIFRINAEVPFMVHYTSIVSKTVILGKEVARYFASSGHCYIQGINTIVIGDYTMIAPGVKIISANHLKGELHQHDKSIDSIKIGSHCWIGANAVILPGVTLGDHVVVAAGSIVTKSFGSNVTIGGNPAKILQSSSES